jgi:FlaA1/EpsC-like NDP-sugar epimerase
MARYFMTIPEACSLVLKAGGVGENGSLYLLDMGEPIKIRDIAEQMIRFYGYEPDIDIKIEVIGLRKGERIEERLWAKDETPVPTRFERIQKVERKPARSDRRLDEFLDRLRPICRFDPSQPEVYRDTGLLRRILKEVAPELK